MGEAWSWIREALLAGGLIATLIAVLVLIALQFKVVYEPIKEGWQAEAQINPFAAAKYFLENSTNVFCEKPGTLCSESLKELIQISKKNNLNFPTNFEKHDDMSFPLISKPIEGSGSKNIFVYKKKSEIPNKLDKKYLYQKLMR